MGTSEASLAGNTSLIGRLERLSASGGDPLHFQLQQQAFNAWLALPIPQQLADLRTYFQDSGWDARLALSEECYRVLVPRCATETEKRLFSCGLRAALALLRNESGSWRGLARLRVGRMLELAQQHHGNLSRKEVSRGLDGSGGHFGRLFARHTGVTFRRYVLWVRMLRAVELLRDPRQRVKSIAGALGYADPSNFVREFRSALGATPGQFREDASSRPPTSAAPEAR